MDKGLKLGGVALTLALTLAACSDNSTQSGGTITPTAATTTAKEEKPQGSAKLGERFKISNLPGNEVFLTLTDIHVGNTCRHGTLDEGEGLAPGRQILEIAGIVEVEKLDNPNNAGHPVMLNTPISSPRMGSQKKRMLLTLSTARPLRMGHSRGGRRF